MEIHIWAPGGDLARESSVKFVFRRAVVTWRGRGRARVWRSLSALAAAALLTFVGAESVVSAADPKPATEVADGQPRAQRSAPAPAANTATEQPAFPLTSDQVAAHLGESVDWFHHLAPIEQLQIAGADSATRERLHQQSLTAVRLAFEFGKACAALLNAESRQRAASSAAAVPAASRSTAGGSTAAATTAADTSTPAKGLAGRLDQAAANVAQRIDGLQSQLDSLKEQIAKARGKERETLVAQQGQVSAALQLAREVQASVQDMENFEATSIAGDKGNLSPLDGQIVDMERSIPELRTLPPTGLRLRAGSGGNNGGGSGANARGSGPSGSSSGGSGTSSRGAVATPFALAT